jgi:hypothetical protein
MPLPLKSDPAEVEWPFETPAPGSGEEAMERALWLSRMQQAMRAADEAVTEEVAKINASYRAASPQPKRTYPDTMQGALQRDDDVRLETGLDEWEYGV